MVRHDRRSANVHWDMAEDSMLKPHAHIMRVTMRAVDENGFGQRSGIGTGPGCSKCWRERWAEIANASALVELDIDARIDHRSLEAQGSVPALP